MFPDYPIDIANKQGTKRMGRINPNGTFSLENCFSIPILDHDEVFRPKYFFNWIDIDFGTIELHTDPNPEPLNGFEQYSIYGKAVPAMVLMMTTLQEVIKSHLFPSLEDRIPDYIWIPYNYAGIIETNYENKTVNILRPITLYYACVFSSPPKDAKSKLVVDMSRPKQIFIPQYRIKGDPPYKKIIDNLLPFAI